MLSRARKSTSNECGRMRVLDALTLCAIAGVVLLVSLPRLRDFAMRENQSDAEALVKRFGAALEARTSDGGMRVDQRYADIAALVEANDELARRLDDVQLFDLGRTLARHGYLFDLSYENGRAVVHAWPQSAGRTGRTVYGWVQGRGAFVEPNAAGAFSGLERPPFELAAAR